MDPVMQAVFGKMPIENLNLVHSSNAKNKSTSILIGCGFVILGVAAFILYQENQKLKKELKIRVCPYKI
jgi:hypothetical protein